MYRQQQMLPLVLLVLGVGAFCCAEFPCEGNSP